MADTAQHSSDSEEKQQHSQDSEEQQQHSPDSEEQQQQASVTGIDLNVQEEATPTSDRETTANPDSDQAGAQEIPFRPLTRIERRNLWLKEYAEQDFALQMWALIVDHQYLEIEMMFQMEGVIVFAVMVNTAHYAQ